MLVTLTGSKANDKKTYFGDIWKPFNESPHG